MANVVARLPSRGPFTVLPAAERTAEPDTHEFDASGVAYQGLHLIIDITAVTDTPTIGVKIYGVDRESGKTYLILDRDLSATGTTVLRIGPDLTASANAIAKDYLPPVFRVQVTHLDADAITYSVAGMLC